MTVQQPPLFDVGPRARPTDPATSQLAADLATRHVAASNDLGRVLRAFAQRGDSMTSDEVSWQLDPRLGRSLHRRVGELERNGYLVATGETRPSHWGRQQRVFALTDRGWDVAIALDGGSQ